MGSFSFELQYRPTVLAMHEFGMNVAYFTGTCSPHYYQLYEIVVSRDDPIHMYLTLEHLQSCKSFATSHKIYNIEFNFSLISDRYMNRHAVVAQYCMCMFICLSVTDLCSVTILQQTASSIFSIKP